MTFARDCPESIPSRPRIEPESSPNRARIDPESIPNRPRIDPESAPNRPRIDPESTPNRTLPSDLHATDNLISDSQMEFVGVVGSSGLPTTQRAGPSYARFLIFFCWFLVTQFFPLHALEAQGLGGFSENLSENFSEIFGENFQRSFQLDSTFTW